MKSKVLVGYWVFKKIQLRGELGSGPRKTLPENICITSEVIHRHKGLKYVSKTTPNFSWPQNFSTFLSCGELQINQYWLWDWHKYHSWPNTLPFCVGYWGANTRTPGSDPTTHSSPTVSLILHFRSKHFLSLSGPLKCFEICGPASFSGSNIYIELQESLIYNRHRDDLIGGITFDDCCKVMKTCRKIIIILSNSFLRNPECISEATYAGNNYILQKCALQVVSRKHYWLVSIIKVCA